jgi:hypothetical protein
MFDWVLNVQAHRAGSQRGFELHQAKSTSCP